MGLSLALFFNGFFWVEHACCAELQRIGIVSAFDPELNAAEAAIIPIEAKSKIDEINGTRFRLIALYGKHLHFFLSGVSMVNAALTTQMAIDHFQLDAIIFSGIAGAVDPELHPGDVVVPAHWIHQMESDWLNPDLNKPGSYVFPETYRPKYGHFEMIFPSDVEVVRKGEPRSRQVHAFPADSYLLSCAKSAAGRIHLVEAKSDHRTVYVGGAAMSGPVFLDNRDFREFAFRTWKVRLHEMEGTAIAQVGYVNRIPGSSRWANLQHAICTTRILTEMYFSRWPAAAIIRIFPLRDLDHEISRHLEPVSHQLLESGFLTEVISLAYEFIPDGNRMLRVRR